MVEIDLAMTWCDNDVWHWRCEKRLDEPGKAALVDWHGGRQLGGRFDGDEFVDTLTFQCISMVTEKSTKASTKDRVAP